MYSTYQQFQISGKELVVRPIFLEQVMNEKEETNLEGYYPRLWIVRPIAWDTDNKQDNVI